ncbi:MAG: complex I NDUFA9 subunit family protein [Pseudomonadota bacterium]
MQATGKLVTVFGGSGFIGRYIVGELARRGYRVRAAVRRPDLAMHLQPLGGVGQIHAVQANLRYPESVAAAVKGADAVVNCVGILFEAGRQRFDAVQAAGANAIASSAAAEGISNVVHLSAIGADSASDSIYARTKAEGEAAMREHVAETVILRPSIVFGPEDGFFNRFASMAQMAPALPLVGGGTTRFQPVYVGDVADAAAMAIDGAAAPGTVYELGGPRVASFKALLEMMLEEIGRDRALVPLPFGMATLMGRMVQWLPSPPLTVDQVTLLKSDNVVSDTAISEKRTLDGLGLTPTAMEAILPSYLGRYRKSGQFANIKQPQ